jgi:hypothetical protein
MSGGNRRVDVDVSGRPFEGEPFEQYRLFVEANNRLSDRRHTTNNLFLSVNSILLGATALLIQQSTGKDDTLLLFLALLLIAAGFVLCIFWIQLMRGYESLLSYRFAYLRKLEATYSTKILQVYTAQTKWREEHHVPSFTKVEARIPLVFLVTYLVAAVGAVALKYDLLATLEGAWPH